VAQKDLPGPRVRHLGVQRLDVVAGSRAMLESRRFWGSGGVPIMIVTGPCFTRQLSGSVKFRPKPRHGWLQDLCGRSCFTD
jgi:hypothetical protein